MIMENTCNKGHTKPLCALLGKIVRVRRIDITLFTSYALYNRVMAEVGVQLIPEDEDDLRSLIR